MFIYFQILILLFVSLALGTFLKNKWAIFFFSIILGLFITLQLVSKNLGGSLIDYKFYEHMNFKDIWSLKSFFSSEIIFFSITFIIISALLYYLSRWFRTKKIPKTVLALCAILGIAVMFIPNGVLNNIYGIIDLKTAKDKSFELSLEELGIDPSGYVTSDEITATPGKNIIVISLESLERGFLEPPLEHLTPKLRKFAQENTYLKMEQNHGSEWTSASMYTVLTGLPAYFKSNSNEIFQNTVSFNGSNLGDILKTAGYKMSYLMTYKEFSGMDNLLGTFNFDVKSELEFDTPYEKSRWGIHDKDLFEEAKKEISLQANKKEPFAIFMSTMSGHFPNGIYDSRMEDVLPKQDNDLEFMTSAVDYYIGELIQHLKDNNLYDNTVVYIFPDHKLMGDTSEVLKKFKNERGLFVISNADETKIKQNIYEPIAQIDLPRMILNGAGIKTNATFLADYIKENNKEDYLRKYRKILLSLNEGLLIRHNYEQGFSLAIQEEGNVEISSNTNSLKNTIRDISENTLYAIEFQMDMRFKSSTEVKNTQKWGFALDRYSEGELKNTFTGKENPTLTFSLIGDSIYGYFKKGKLYGITRAGVDKISFSEEDLKIFKNWKTTITDTDLNPTKVFLRSTSGNFIKSYGHSRIFTGLKPYIITRGLNVLYIEDNKYKVKNFDTYGSAADAEAFMKTIENLVKANRDFAMVTHDAASAELEPYKRRLASLGFEVLSDLNHREAYISYSQEGEIHEKRNDRTITIELNIENLPKHPEITLRKKDTLRFIAHAGGGINGDTYTNSLEALDLNYSKGFRLFELDIIKTADDIFVAAHDWKQWAQKTKYKGELPPTLEVFHQNPIKNYTPMDIDRINLWFKEHPDAILVTDKVNNPTEFAPHFVDKNRMMMELFTTEAIIEAQKLDIKTLVGQNVLWGLRGKELETLQGWDVEYIAMSRTKILDHLPLLKTLKDAGIKTYVYSINHNSIWNEDYVVENEMDYIYGMYADEWDFNN